jgi:hypothetical protein
MDFNVEYSYTGLVDRTFMKKICDVPRGISLGNSMVCSTVYVPGSTGHVTETFAFRLHQININLIYTRYSGLRFLTNIEAFM